MGILLRNFRRWWQPPRDLEDRERHRQVTFLELFYDLVYVVLIAELTHSLASNPDLPHIGNFVFLFLIVWWAWFNGTTYHDAHGNNDIRTRVFTFLQMICVAGMAVFAHDAIGETAVGFALFYAAFQLILTYLWWRTGVYDPSHRPLSQPYTVGFLINTFLFVASVFVEPPLRYTLWVIATLASLAMPAFIFRAGRGRPDVQAQIDLSTTPTPSLIERFGLLTIIVLGEVIVAVVQGVAGHHDLSVEVGLIGLLGMLIAIGLWWLYFDFISHRVPRVGSGWTALWAYMHLPVTIGMATIGAAVLNVMEHAGDPLPSEIRWLLVIAIAVVLVSIMILIRSLQYAPEVQDSVQRGGMVILVSAVVILGLGILSLETIPLLAIIAVLLLTPIVYALIAWVRNLEVEETKE